ncbi:MAG: hypothetical protein Q7S22_06750 [Candidatus Micrarchaeota archaeon]|nr:hypothetical protein [Candidatus Micrarchaeota archaeon]
MANIGKSVHLDRLPPSKSTQAVAIEKKAFGGDLLECKALLGTPKLEGIYEDRTGTLQKLAEMIIAHRTTRYGKSIVEMYGEAMHDLSGIVTILTPNQYRKAQGKAATFDSLKVRSTLLRTAIEFQAEATVNELMAIIISKTWLTGTLNMEVPAIPDIQHLIACALARELKHDAWLTKFNGMIATGERDGEGNFISAIGEANGITIIGGRPSDAATTLILMSPISYDSMTLMDDESAKTLMLIASARQTIVNLLGKIPNVDLQGIKVVAEKVARLLKMAFVRNADEAANFAIELANQDTTQALFSNFIESQVPEIVEYVRKTFEAATTAAEKATTREINATEAQDSEPDAIVNSNGQSGNDGTNGFGLN